MSKSMESNDFLHPAIAQQERDEAEEGKKAAALSNRQTRWTPAGVTSIYYATAAVGGGVGCK